MIHEIFSIQQVEVMFMFIIWSPGEDICDSEVGNLVQDAEKYSLANHLFWGLWGIISVCIYLPYSKFSVNLGCILHVFILFRYVNIDIWFSILGQCEQYRLWLQGVCATEIPTVLAKEASNPWSVCSSSWSWRNWFLKICNWTDLLLISKFL